MLEVMTNDDPEENYVEMPEAYVVNFEALSGAKKEDEFTREAFELLKEASILLTLVAGIRLEAEHADGLGRNQAIVVGNYSRMIKLMKSLVRQISDGHGGDQQLSISREFIEGVSTVRYVLDDPGDGSRYDAYVVDGLVSEKEFMKNVREQISKRGGSELPIEVRIKRSIEATYAAAGVTEDAIPSRKNNQWPSAQTRIDLLGPTAYSAYRGGSGAIHGAFSDIEKHHLEAIGDHFEIDLEPAAFRPQPLLTISLLALITIERYMEIYFSAYSFPEKTRLDRLIEDLQRVDELHERWLTLHPRGLTV